MRTTIYQKIFYWMTIYILFSFFHEPLLAQTCPGNSTLMTGNCIIAISPESPLGPSSTFSSTQYCISTNATGLQQTTLNFVASTNSTIIFPTTPPNTTTASIDGIVNIEINNQPAPTLNNLVRKLNRLIERRKKFFRRSKKNLPFPSTGTYYFSIELAAYQVTNELDLFLLEGNYSSNTNIPFSTISNMTIKLTFPPTPPLTAPLTFQAIVLRQNSP
jgi:hypothetical protein